MKMSKRFSVSIEGEWRFYEGTANDMLKIVRKLEKEGAVPLYINRVTLRTQRLYELHVQPEGFYVIYRKGVA